jgi:hypothetical protein
MTKRNINSIRIWFLLEFYFDFISKTLFFDILSKKHRKTFVCQIMLVSVITFSVIGDKPTLNFQATKLSMDKEPSLASTLKRHQIPSGSRHASWTEKQDGLLTKAAPQFTGPLDNLADPRFVKGSWTSHEDQMIIQHVTTHGTKYWADLARQIPGRTGKQCRERWKSQLDARNLTNSAWTPQEDEQLIELHRRFGNRWTRIASFFSGRTDNAVKNRWNSTLQTRITADPTSKGNELPSKLPVPDMGSDMTTRISFPVFDWKPSQSSPISPVSWMGGMASPKAELCSLEENRKILDMLIRSAA